MCTYKRTHLKTTLLSIAALQLSDAISLEVVVVDNDEALFGKSIIDDLLSGQSYPYKLIYVSEPKKNISAARNMCLQNATGDWVAFIDDDEVADKHWLTNLHETAVKYEADAVFGRVISTYPKDTPQWIIEGSFFDRKERDTGSEVSSGACNCTLVKNNAINGQLFDLAYGLSGGEDADFFHRLHKKGHKLVYCQEAIVSEEIEKNRLCIEFLISRKIRIGSSFSKYRYENQSFMKKTPYIIKNSLILVAELLATMISYPFGKVHFYKWLLKSADRYGKLKYFYSNTLQDLY
jgi:succinoglycan biosynthesis protein ExoM